MTGSLALYAENKVLEHIVGKASFGLPSPVYVGLFTVAPTDEDGTGGTEASAGNYARKSTAGADWSAAANGHIENGNDITFVMCATANWGEIFGFALFDALSNGNMLAWGELSTSKTIDIGDTAKFSSTELDITLN